MRTSNYDCAFLVQKTTLRHRWGKTDVRRWDDSQKEGLRCPRERIRVKERVGDRQTAREREGEMYK